MKYETNARRAAAASRGRLSARSRGVALVTTLILLALLGAASLAVGLLVSSDTFINGYYRNYRGSFYAADSGVNAIVETMKNGINAAGDDSAVPPLPADGSVPASVTTAYNAFKANYYSVGDPGSWSGKFEAAPATILRTAQPPSGQTTYCVQAPGAATPTDKVTCDYIYPFTVVVNGQSSGSEQEQIVETGTIHYHSYSGEGASGGLPSFAKWGAFITDFDACQGPLVPGTMTGPFFTDGQWNFGNYSNPGYTFTDTIGQAGSQASWWKNNKCSNSTSAPNGFSSPNFQGGFNLSQAYVQAPSDTYNQAQAVLDGKGIPPCTSAPCPTDPPPSQATMAAELKTVSGGSYPASGSVPSGVYIPMYSTTSGGVTTYNYGTDPTAPGNSGYAGGFYIQGNASISLSASTDGSGNPTQKYTITQGGTTTTITVDTATNQTTVKSGGTTKTLTGVPTQLDPNSGAVITEKDPSNNPVSPTMIYVNGQISGLSGTVQDQAGITIAASDDISITGNVTYASSPVSIPSDALNSSTNAGVLGIYTNGNINLYPGSGGNLTVDASLAALSGVTGGTSGFRTPGSGIGTWTILGGRAEDQAHSVNINTGNTYYDRRFTSGSFGPPWFPTAVPQLGTTAVPAKSGTTVSRTSWQEASRM